MRDIELQARLEQLLGAKLPPALAAQQARKLTALIRDRLAPLARTATAIAKGKPATLGYLPGECPAVNLAGLGQETKSRSSTAVSYGATGATVGSVVPIVGTAIGFAVGAIAGYLLGGKHYINVNDDNAEEDQDVLDIWPQYRKIAGQVAGRDIGLPLLERIWRGATYSQSDFTLNNGKKCFHNGCLKYPGNPDWINGHLRGGSGAKSFPTLLSQSGAMNPQTFIDQVFIPAQRTDKPPWAVPATPAGRQVLIDIADALMAPKGAPYTYGTPQQSAALPQALAPAAPPVTPGVVSMPTTAPPQTLIATTPSTSTEDLLRAFLAQQGVNANSPQAQILLRDVGSGGVQMTPQGPAFAGFGGAGLPTWLLGGAAILALSFALARPAPRRAA